MKLSKRDQKIVELCGANEETADIADMLGISTRTVQRVIQKYRRAGGKFPEKEVEVDLTKKQRKDELKQERKKYKEALGEIEKLRREIGTLRDAQIHTSNFSPIKIPTPSASKKEAVAFINAGDWHVDEVVDPASVNGLNKFNLDIAKKRANTLWQVSLNLLDMCRSKNNINTLVVPLLGDFMSGWIHEELMIYNSMSPNKAMLELFDMLGSGLQFLADNAGVKKIIVVPVCGNHARLTHRPHNKYLQQTSFEWAVYEFLVKHFKAKENKIIHFKLPEGYFNLINIYDRVIRIHHGNNIRYGGGIGGVHIPLRKAIDKWNSGIKADRDILGHWHTEFWDEDYLLNGSLIGYSEYSIKIKAPYQRPMQSFFIEHPKYGMTARFPIVLEEKPDTSEYWAR